MYTTLDHLENVNYRKKPKNIFWTFLKEIKTILVIFFLVSIWLIVFTNIQVFYAWITDLVDSGKENLNLAMYDEKNIYQDSSISNIIQDNSQKEQEVQSLIDEKKKNSTDLNYVDDSLESILKNSTKNYDFKFNTLPPVNRLIVSSLNVDAPLNLSQYKDVKDFTNWNFDEELKHGVVLYPTTPVPWDNGNTLIFGHTSQEFRKLKENPYWNVFVNIPKMEVWDEIKAVWKWKLYTYKVIDKVIKTPKQVNVEYLKYQDGNYITLMWCYPIGTDKERIMVIGKLVGG